MRILTFIFILTFLACGNEKPKQEGTQSSPTVETNATETTSATSTSTSDGEVKYKKTAANSEFAVYRTISADETHTTYFFKTLDGISIDFKVSIEGEPETIVPKNLLEYAKYLEGHPGANPEMAGRVFEIIYDKDNFVGEVKLAETE